MGHLRNTRSKYLEKPATPDEDRIANLIEKMSWGINNNDLDSFIGVFSESAQVALFEDNKKLFSKEECKKFMKKVIPGIKEIFYSDIFIRAKENEAIVSCIGHTFFRDGRS